MSISTYRQHYMEQSLKSTTANSSHIENRMHLALPVMTCPNGPTWQAATRLAYAHGYNSLVSFTLDQKKQLFFSSTDQAFISYVLQGNVVIAIGDPIGPTRALPLVLDEFLAFWRARHKAVVFWQAREDLLDRYRSQGLYSLKIGEDAIIDVQNFTLKGGKMANVRTSARRAEKDGLQVLFYEDEALPVFYREQMIRISQDWLARKGSSEMGFSMGRFEPDSQARHITALAVDQHYNVHAFLTFVPIYGRNGWNLDLLRRDTHATPGAMELLLVRSLEYFKECGNSMVSLGLAPLGNHNQNKVSFLGRCCSLLLRRFHTFQHFQSLTAFKRKFQPTWENRYLIFSHPIHLLQIGSALYTVHYRQR